MFTSRAEYRLLLREHIANLRLMEKGYQLRLIATGAHLRLKNKKQEIQRELQRLEETRVHPSPEVQEWLKDGAVCLASYRFIRGAAAQAGD